MLATLAACAAPDGGDAARADGAPVAAADAWRAELSSWRAEREAALRSAEGYLALSDLVWLAEGPNAMGADPSCAVVLADDGLPPHLGVLHLEDGVVTLRSPSPVLRLDGEPIVGPRALSSDADGAPDRLEAGRRTVWIVERAGQVGVRVRDPESPVLAAFAGTSWYAPDPRWRVPARFVPHDAPRPVDVPNILGSTYDDVSLGVVRLELDGAPVTLTATGADAASMFVIFGDATNGDTTYGGGRVLDLPAPGPDGALELDFNRAYNLPCAFTPYTTCPMPPAGNRLAVAVEAGERVPDDA